MRMMRLLFVGFMLVVILGMSIMTSVSAADVDPAKLKWESIAFGQSTDLNFSSTITPAKVGVNRAIPEVPGTLEGKIVLESRGGKVAAGHDGLTFYYTVLDPRKTNFVLEAEILVEQFGPETEAMPNSQTACGLMVRDVIGAPRKDPMVFGYEELPAASNLAATAVFSGNKTTVNVTALNRNGIFQPWGNSDSTLTQKAFKKEVPVGERFKLKLERTDQSFIMTYSDLEGGNAVAEEMAGIADIVQVCEKDKMYLGFFAARNAKMVVSNAKLTLSTANTNPGKPYQAKPFDQFFELESSDVSGSENYILMARSGYQGAVAISQDGTVVAENKAVEAGEFFKYNTTLQNAGAKFEVTFTPLKGPASQAIIKKIAVEKRAINSLIAAPNGKPAAAGTAEDPLDLATAVKLVPPGGVIMLRGGNYGAFTISRLYSGMEGKLKKIMPYQQENAVFNGLISLASYWHYYGIESTASQSYGFRTQGNGNILERCVAHDNLNTGFQLDSFTRNPALKASDNLYLNCDAYDNADPTLENADGFAAKNNIGKGNIYRGCIAHHNADDGWDFFNNVQNGPNEPALVENCIAYLNGITSQGKTAGGALGSGFKMGGETQLVPHVVKNCLAFNNKLDGITCNFNPGALVIENCTSFNNARFNFIFRSNPYLTPSGILRNNLSFRNDKGTTLDFVAGKVFANNFFQLDKKTQVKETDFVSLQVPASYGRDENGNISWGDFLRLAPKSTLNKAGTNKTFVGALPAKR